MLHHGASLAQSMSTFEAYPEMLPRSDSKHFTHHGDYNRHMND
jgi:hypothetical protein